MEPDAVFAALEGLREEVRRAARAALAAKAAAEEAARPPSDDAWATSLLPALDVLDRCEREARRPGLPARRGRWWQVAWTPSPATPAVLADGIRLAREALESALAARGYRVVRPEGAKFDAVRHRAVDARRDGTVGHVVEVVRAGLVRGDTVVRESDVVVGGGRGAAVLVPAAGSGT